MRFNISLAIYLKYKSQKLYFVTESDSFLQYEYLIEVLINSYFNIIDGFFYYNTIVNYCHFTSNNKYSYVIIVI